MNDLFLQLMEYFLTVLNHEDTRAVELAYEIYGQATKGGWSLRELKSQVCLSYQKDEDVKETLGEELSESEPNQSAEEWDDNVPLTQKSPMGNWVERCIRDIKNSMYEHIPQGVWRLLKKDKSKRNYEEEKERFVFEPEEDEEEQVSRPTVLLTELAKTPEGILRYEGNGECRDLTITKEDYLIGSDRTCPGYIPSDTVSRRHARITRVDDIYFVEDLNSSNGTYVGGELLNYKTKVSLQKNEIVIFANEKFRFI